MKLPPLHGGVLLRRYKRFLADVRLDDGREVTAHCPNPGAMSSCAAPGWRVALSHHPDPKRKLKWSWELSYNEDGVPILVNTARPNQVVGEALAAGQLPELAGYASLRPEVRYGEGSRVDFLLSDPARPDCYVEVKSVTLKLAPGLAAFPDAVTTRGEKHLRELMKVVAEGQRGVLLFLVGRGDVTRVRAAEEIDPRYAATLLEAQAAGVEVLAYRAAISEDSLGVSERIVFP